MCSANDAFGENKKDREQAEEHFFFYESVLSENIAAVYLSFRLL